MMPTDKVKQVRDNLRNLMNRVPLTSKLDSDDIGYLIVSAICQSNGARLVDEEIYHGNILIGKSVKYRFDGDILNIAYQSLTGKIITRTLRIAV